MLLRVASCCFATIEIFNSNTLEREMYRCVYVSNVCNSSLTYTFGLEESYQLILPEHKTAVYFYSVMNCEKGHTNFVCKYCGIVIDDKHYLHTHLMDCSCGYIIRNGHINTECIVYETREINRMMAEFNRGKGENVTINDIILYISSYRINRLFPLFVYLQRNEEMFKKMDIENIYLGRGHISGTILCGIVCPAETIDKTVKSIINEMIRCSEGLEFQCSIPISIGVDCGMVYDSFPSYQAIMSHINTKH